MDSGEGGIWIWIFGEGGAFCLFVCFIFLNENLMNLTFTCQHENTSSLIYPFPPHTNRMAFCFCHCLGNGEETFTFWSGRGDVSSVSLHLYTVMRTSLLVDTTHCDVPRVHLPAPALATAQNTLRKRNHTEKNVPSHYPSSPCGLRNDDCNPKWSRNTATDD